MFAAPEAAASDAWLRELDLAGGRSARGGSLLQQIVCARADDVYATCSCVNVQAV